jgi:hypothetical protein
LFTEQNAAADGIKLAAESSKNCFLQLIYNLFSLFVKIQSAIAVAAITTTHDLSVSLRA